MKVLVTDNAHLYKTPDGKYYTPSIYGYEFFQRYLNIFDEVRFVAKTKYVESIDQSKFLLVTGEGLEIYELPWYQGIKGLLKSLPKLFLRSRRACIGCNCYIYRISQIESFLVYLLGKKKNRPFAVEVVNDPLSLFADNPVLKIFSVGMMNRMLRKANGASYITSNVLQRIYPCKAREFGETEACFEGSYTTLDLDEEDIYLPKQFEKPLKHLKIIHVANTIYDEKKGHRTVIDILKELLGRGYFVTVKFIGDGPGLPMFKQYAKDLGVSDNVVFVGRLPSRKEILTEMNKSDIFVFPSHSEGIGRVNIEAQAAGLPCLSSNVGGIVELFDKKYLFDPLDVEGYVNAIIRLWDNPQEMDEMSKTNIENARKYTKDRLTEKRNAFYIKLKILAETVTESGDKEV